MNEVTSMELKRDCPAIQIPAGDAVTLVQGTPVDVTQRLGGTFTVRTPSGLFRIAARDADALGLQPGDAGGGPALAAADAFEEQQVWDALKTCYDPEIPVNIVDLGLVYDLHTEPLPSGNHKVFVKMTLTAPGCGMGPSIARDAQEKLICLPKIEDAVVEIVWDPPWHQSMITAEGRRILGLE